jgi:hypothetical protein
LKHKAIWTPAQSGLTTTQIRLNKVNRNRQSSKLSFSLHNKKKDNLAQNGGKTWKRIGWLMLAGEIMLLLFLVQWLHSQYQIQEKRLHQDIKSLFISTEGELTDSLLNQTIAVILNNPEGHPKVQLRITSSSDTALLNDTFGKILPERNQAMTLKESQPGDTAHTIVKQMIIRSHTDTNTDKEPLPEDVQKILRLAIVQTANAKDLYAHGFSLSADSTTLFKTFQKELRRKQSGFIAHWDTATQLQDTGKLFRFRYRNMPMQQVSVTGYHTYLLRSILPQIGFFSDTAIAYWSGLLAGLSHHETSGDVQPSER